MKLKDIMESKTTKGTYAAVTFNRNTNKLIHDYIKETKLPNAVRPDRLHTTLLYSRKYVPEFKAQGKIDPPWIGEPESFDVWESQEGARCLVLKYSCKKLEQRHKELMDKYDATYDFLTYQPHITFSYDIGDIDPADLPDVRKFVGDIEIVEEYDEDLDLDWAATKATINKTKEHKDE